MTVAQIPLSLRFAQRAGLDDYFDPGSRVLPVFGRWLQAPEGVLLLTGPMASGKTHLALAACAQWQAQGMQVSYLPLREGVDQAMLDAQAPSGVLVIDDVDAALASMPLQQSLFALHNRQRDAGGALLYCSRLPIHEWAEAALPDLRSRIAQGLQLGTPTFDDAGRKLWLEESARRRGFELDAPALEFLIRRVGRDFASLTAMLEWIDRSSLAAKRRVTVPFLSDLLAQRAAGSGPD